MTTNKSYFKKKSKPAILITILVIGSVLVYYVLREQEVVYSAPKWNCEYMNLEFYPVTSKCYA